MMNPIYFRLIGKNKSNHYRNVKIILQKFLLNLYQITFISLLLHWQKRNEASQHNGISFLLIHLSTHTFPRWQRAEGLLVNFMSQHNRQSSISNNMRVSYHRRHHLCRCRCCRFQNSDHAKPTHVRYVCIVCIGKGMYMYT